MLIYFITFYYYIFSYILMLNFICSNFIGVARWYTWYRISIWTLVLTPQRELLPFLLLEWPESKLIWVIDCYSIELFNIVWKSPSSLMIKRKAVWFITELGKCFKAFSSFQIMTKYTKICTLPRTESIKKQLSHWKIKALLIHTQQPTKAVMTTWKKNVS